MAQTAGASSPAPGSFKTIQEEIGYYKSQYEHLESELQDFQASSRELETEMEKDIEASEKREKDLKQKVEGLRYEVDEWKVRLFMCRSESIALTQRIDKVQAIQGGSEFCPEQPTEGNHHITRNEPDPSTEATRC